MGTNRKDVIYPTEMLTQIGVALEDFQRFSDVFWNKAAYDFHVKGKSVVGTQVIFDVRSMRVNEFVDILDVNDIKWVRVRPPVQPDTKEITDGKQNG
jgi:hypothetical protein